MGTTSTSIPVSLMLISDIKRLTTAHIKRYDLGNIESSKTSFSVCTIYCNGVSALFNLRHLHDLLPPAQRKHGIKIQQL